MSMRVLRGLGFVKILLAAALFVTLATPVTFGQAAKVPDWQTAAGGKMEFAVASIRPGKPGEFTYPNFPISNDDSYTAGPNDSFVAGFSLESYIEFAYKLRLSSDQRRAMLANLPGWVSTDAYVIRAKADGNVTKDQLRLMMQSLLADRFKLAVHFETKEVPVLALTLVKPGKLGPKLRPHAEGPPCDRPDDKMFPYQCDSYAFRRTPNHTFMEGSRNTTMSLLAASLTSIPGVSLAHTVVDQTGLSGRYDFTLEWAPESNGSAAPSAGVQPDPQGPTILEALKEQLGMELKSTKAPLSVLVIDHVERPSEN
jgi:bla regulator protein BlaR1